MDLEYLIKVSKGSIFWVKRRSFLILFFIKDMDVERSELLLEPGIMMPKELVELLFINFCINPFYIQEAWKIKLFFAKSSLIKGTNSSIFVLRGLFFNNSHSDMGNLYFNSLNVSIKVWYIYRSRWWRDNKFISLNSGLVCSNWKFFSVLCWV